MPIQENALNSALAEALSEHDLHATPEQTHANTGSERCDVQVRRKYNDRYFTAVECKIGQGATQQHAAVRDAQRWLRQTDCWNALAVCYPEELSEDSAATPRQRFMATEDLLMVRVGQGGELGRWRKGRLSELALLADDIGANETYAVTDILQQAILLASQRIDSATGRDLARTLELPWMPRTRGGIDPRPARIACLILANMALLQNRMRSEGLRIPGLKPLLAIRRSRSKQTALLDNWRRIRAVDYAPVVDPALLVLETLPADHHTNSLLETLIDAVFECAPRIRGLQLDHAGPLYHGLLQTAPDTGQRRAAGAGYSEEAPELQGLCDLVIMNPPFTRNDIRNRSLPQADRKRVQQHEIHVAQNALDKAHRDAINQSTIFSFFAPIADRLLNESGAIAIVQPFTACTGAGAKGHRNILSDPDRFHLELVVTSHDNRRIFFSENTDIHESLVVARRPTPETCGKPTAFVSLAENPASPSEAHFLAEAIRQARNGEEGPLSQYGTIAWRSPEQLRGRPWNAACFYEQSLADAYDILLDCPTLKPLGELASVEPEGRRIRDAFQKAEQRQSPDMRALWFNKTARQTAMRTAPDVFLSAKRNMRAYAEHLWRKRSNLLLANRMRLNLTQTPAVFSDEPVLGSAFVPASPRTGNAREFCKAWCVWFNSTFGVIAFLNTRQKNLTYPNFSLEGLRSLPAPCPDHCDTAALAAVFDDRADDHLQPLPRIHLDPVRDALDNAVLAAVPGLPTGDLPRWRQSIALEPSINNEKDPFRLSEAYP